MNESVSDYLYYAAWIMLFLIALGTASTDISIQQQAQHSMQEAATVDHRLFTTFGSVEEETYSGAEVLQSIQSIQNIRANIQAEGVTFQQTLDIDSTDVSMINLRKTYKVQYVRDASGTVTTIIFT
ncbi:hypothetical protein [Paenibacillus illinoisensis]|uniref:Uncharacterized protein n=1 Tax=Paenibacillus illinoisensis TaxID=59845 RepID=A0A2W0CJD6_9BACL|nr:hypothetical protein [Paenibacillus illinoisensis]PYY31009.1 Uncharacterized protein PIL02S_00556 [Paenibacillus illinoisensis]